MFLDYSNTTFLKILIKLGLGNFLEIFLRFIFITLRNVKKNINN